MAENAPRVSSGSLEMLRGPRLWLFRLMALALLPMMLLLGETALRLVGTGYSPSFFIPGPNLSTDVSNYRFAWSYFPPHLAREPVPLELHPKTDGTQRIFVLGGSAAQGVPEPGFGVAQHLEALLELRHPGRGFEVHNAAMTAINSHVVRQIADDVLAEDPDLLVLYLGNNEVVGPFGAGSVFGRFSSRLGSIRLATTLQRSRWGQLLRGWTSPPSSGETWQGMEMFLQQQVTQDDARLQTVYRHLETNLEHIARLAERADVPVVLSTVVSNLRHQPPFASRRGAADAEAWEQALEAGRSALESGDIASGVQHLERARALDDEHAATAFHLGRALWVSGDLPAARRAYADARDLDTLRFRADSDVNRVIRGVGERAPGVTLVDPEKTGLVSLEPREDGWDWGAEAFYEHVHLRPHGNTGLARAWLPAVEAALDLQSRNQGPSRQDVERRLAFTPYDALIMEQAMLALVQRPPFSAQWGHSEDLAQRRRRIQDLRRTLGPEAWAETRQRYADRLDSHPGDLGLRRRWAEHLERRGDLTAAEALWRELSQRYPGGGAWQDALATNLANQGRFDEALDAIEASQQVAPHRRGEIHINRGRIYAMAGRLGDAEAEYQQAVEARPEDPTPLYNLAELEVQRRDLDGALRGFEEVVERFPRFSLGQYNLGVALARQGRLEASLQHFDAALEVDPFHAPSHNSRGLSLEGLGRIDAARQAYRRALEVAPEYSLAAFNLADSLLQGGNADDLVETIALYRLGLERQPGNTAARRNLFLAERRLGVSP